MSLRTVPAIALACCLAVSARAAETPVPGPAQAAENASATTPTAAEFRFQARPQSYFRIQLRYPGIYRVWGRDLQAAGADLARIRPDKLALENEGETIPINVRCASGSLLGPDDCIEFWGTYPRGSYSTYKPYNLHNVYFLLLDADKTAFYKSRRLTSDVRTVRSPIYMEKIHFEPDTLFRRTTLPPGISDNFFWTIHAAGSKIEWPCPVYSVDLSTSQPVRMKFRMLGLTSTDIKPAHQIQISYAGNSLGLASFDTTHYFDFETSFTPTMPLDRAKLEFTTPPDRASAVDAIGFDSVDIEYPRRINAGKRAMYRFNNDLIGYALPADVEVADTLPGSRVFVPEQAIVYEPQHAKSTSLVVHMDERSTTYVTIAEPQVLSPDAIRWHAVPPCIDKPPPEASVLAIYHPDVKKSAECYAKYRVSQGQQVHLVNVLDVYDSLSRGFIEDTSLKRFIRYTVERTPSIAYVVLFGDSTYDYREIDYEETRGIGDGRTYSILLPIHWIFNPVVPHSSGYPDDNWYASFKWQNTPDIAIGRIPVNSDAEGFAYVQKIIEYEQFQLSRKDKALLISSVEASFQDLVKHISREMADKFTTLTLLFPETRVATREVARLCDEIDAGVQLIYYVGHGGSFVWRVGPVDSARQKDLFTPAEVARLKNKGHYPVITCSSCYTTSFDAKKSLGEVFVTRAEAGCIAMIGTPWKSTVYEDHVFNEKLIRNFMNPAIERLGDAFVLAKKATRPARDSETQYQSFTLLGDPCLKIARLN